jgi:hypothetical protein
MEVVSHPCVPPMYASHVRKSQDRHLGPSISKWAKRSTTKISGSIGKSKWEKPIADWLIAAGVDCLGPKNHDLEAKGVERNDGWFTD